jgi:hypothetical protein
MDKRSYSKHQTRSVCRPAEEEEQTTVVDLRTLETLAEQLKLVSEGLLQTRAEAKAARSAAQQAKAANAALKKQLDKQGNNIAGPLEFKSKGNAAQYTANASVITDLARALTALEDGESVDVETAIRAGVQSLNGRNKLIKIADNSSVGWAIIEEYQKADVASDDEDDKRIRNAEAAAVAKRKNRNEASRGRGGNRGNSAYRGHGHHSQYVPYAGNYRGGESYGNSGRGGRHEAPRQQNEYQQSQGQRQGYSQSQYQGYAQPQQQQQSQHYQPPPPYQPNNSQYQRMPGPCYLCGGPHLMRFCPGNGRRTEEVQSRIENQYQDYENEGYDNYDRA